MLLNLYPPPAGTLPVEGAYLAEALREGPPVVYANFIASLDGRIAQSSPDNDRLRIPPAIANPRDWRLYAELLAQADVVLASPSLLQRVAAGQQPGLLTLTGERYAPLAHWRQQHHLAPHPALAVVTESLQIPADALARMHLPPLVITSSQADPARRHLLEKEGARVVVAGDSPGLSGAAIIDALRAAGHAHIYSVAGPRMLHTLAEANRLDRLYFTLATTLVGGEQFETLTRGALFSPPRGFTLQRLLLDPEQPEGANQLFAVLRPSHFPAAPR